MTKVYGLWTGESWARTHEGAIIWSEHRRVVQMYLNEAREGGFATDEYEIVEIGKSGHPVGDQDVHLTVTGPIEKEG